MLILGLLLGTVGLILFSLAHMMNMNNKNVVGVAE